MGTARLTMYFEGVRYIGYTNFIDEVLNLVKDLAYTLVRLEKQPKIEKADDLEQVIASLRFADVSNPSTLTRALGATDHPQTGRQTGGFTEGFTRGRLKCRNRFRQALKPKRP